jgi:hypothetical protein
VLLCVGDCPSGIPGDVPNNMMHDSDEIGLQVLQYVAQARGGLRMVGNLVARSVYTSNLPSYVSQVILNIGGDGAGFEKTFFLK